MEIGPSFIEYLNQEFKKRRNRNSAYSLRSFSRDLKVNPGRLSQYFTGARKITQKAAIKVMNQLGLSPIEQAKLMGINIEPLKLHIPEPKLIEQKVFELISEPIHFTLLSLLETNNFKNNNRWIAGRINSSVLEVSQSIKLLKELGLIIESKGKLFPSHKEGIRFNTDSTSNNVALRKAHKKQLEQAIESIEKISVDLRDITSITVATDLKKITKAKELIKEFRRKISALLETDEATEVFRLQIQLIPVTTINKEKLNEKNS